METKMHASAATSYEAAKSRAARLWKLADATIGQYVNSVRGVELIDSESIQALAAREEAISGEIYRDPESWYEVIRNDHEPACQCAVDPNREEFACRECQCAAHVELSEVF